MQRWPRGAAALSKCAMDRLSLTGRGVEPGD
jgi:hypothetical protein